MRVRPTSALPGLIVLVAAFGAACLGGSGGRPPAVTATPPTPSPAQSALMGQWELVSVDTEGQSVPATGRLSYDEFNNIAVRAELPPGTPNVTPPRVVLLDFRAKAVVSGGQLAYVGVQRQAPQEQMIPTSAEPSDWHYYALEGDTLRMWRIGQGGQPMGTLVFRRVS